MFIARDWNTNFALKECLFGGVKLVKNTDPDEYVYPGYCIGFDLRSKFSLPDGSMGKMLLFLELIWAHLRILTIRQKISWFFVKDQRKD